MTLPFLSSPFLLPEYSFFLNQLPHFTFLDSAFRLPEDVFLSLLSFSTGKATAVATAELTFPESASFPIILFMSVLWCCQKSCVRFLTFPTFQKHCPGQGLLLGHGMLPNHWHPSLTVQGHGWIQAWNLRL